ncbi:MAG: ATP-binding cassette domain-containing protein [Nitrospirae bacterium]|nr:ATP-binding cassette domain-containing protein [Nitrospirota bacterium]
MNIIEVVNLSKNFKTKKGFISAVKDVSFNVKRGELFGFLGPNGAGKTTTINILCTLLTPTSGRALLNSFDVVSNPNEVRQSIGLVFQEPSLDEKLTAMENLEFHAMLYNVPKAVRNERIKYMLEMVGLYDRKDDLVNTFSGGMKRRLEIARGLLHYPKILFLDEPTLGLDPQTRSHIWEYIHQLRKKEDITIFLTTHYMGEAENCDRVAIIDYGEIIAIDSPFDLKKEIGGDVITVVAEDRDKAKKTIEMEYNVAVINNDEGLHFEVENGETFLPRFIKKADFKILSISLRRPTLEDVFIRLTGRHIREESAEANSVLKIHARRLRR